MTVVAIHIGVGRTLQPVVSVRALAGKGLELCEPCLHLQQLTRPGIIRELVHRAGINADILTDGTISLGDPIEETGA